MLQAFLCTGTGGEVAAELLRRWWKSVLVLFSSVCFLNLWPMFLCINSPEGCGLLSGWQDKSLGCSICMLMDRCEELLNSRTHEGQDADKVYSVRGLFFGAEGREECRKGLPSARQWVLAGGRQEAWMSPPVHSGWHEQKREFSYAFFWLIFKLSLKILSVASSRREVQEWCSMIYAIDSCWNLWGSKILLLICCMFKTFNLSVCVVLPPSPLILGYRLPAVWEDMLLPAVWVQEGFVFVRTSWKSCETNNK